MPGDRVGHLDISFDQRDEVDQSLFRLDSFEQHLFLLLRERQGHIRLSIKRPTGKRPNIGRSASSPRASR